ncbi:pyridoxamine 5'-phosphate oxidase family protein [Amycolatopsis benzoatilytica]|uniref:pyridoxamine 5'-phosphate oxidase family protein n=1 Tax=Amycolatopsis benzoatilytica TaxID=346045 RepID=UPI00036347A1|nr:pyridoxamine 5'-phosphate oxidase family protein [Amycolatopsis benzoatilytica]
MSGAAMVELDRATALRLLSSAVVGRIVFTQNALPAIRPVNHLVDEDLIIIRSHAAAALMSSVDRVVAYEADHFDPGSHAASWSVVATGILRAVTDPAAIVRYERLLRPWVAKTMDQILQIEPRLITGFSLNGADADG